MLNINKLIKKLLRDSTVEKKYVKSGAIFGDVVSYLPMGECIGFEGLLKNWENWEKEYARRGYRTVSLDRFVNLGGYNKSIDDVIGQKRELEEESIFHAKIYRENFLGKQIPFTIEELGESWSSGTYILPSTENFKQSKLTPQQSINIIQ